METEKRDDRRYLIISVVSTIVFLIVWQLVTDVFGIVNPHALASPVTVFKGMIVKLYTKAPEGATLPSHIMHSLQITLLGFLAGSVVGVPLGILSAWYRKFDLAFRPVFDIIRPIPPVGWIPIMILLLGIGVTAKTGVIFLAALVPNVINSYAGIKRTSTVHLWVASTFGATNLQKLFRVAIPTAVPMIFTGLRVSLTASWMTLVAAELLAATAGLGYMIQMGRAIGRIDIILIGMIVMGLIGSIFSAILTRVEEKVMRGYHHA